MRSAPVVVGLLILVGLLWIGGELHRSNCIRQGRVACSVLPWDNGNAKPAQRRPRRQRGRRASLSGGTLTGFRAASSAGTSALRALSFRIVPG